MSFTCNSCPNICCVNTPSFSSIDECIEFINRFPSTTLVVYSDDRGSLVSLARVGNQCQFSSNDGCSVFDFRPSACRDTQCKLLDSSKLDLVSFAGIATGSTQLFSRPSFAPPFLTTKELLSQLDSRGITYTLFTDPTQYSFAIAGISSSVMGEYLLQITSHYYGG